MNKIKQLDDVPPQKVGNIDVEFLQLKNDVVVLLLGSKIKVMYNEGKDFTLQELEWLRHYVHKKIKSLDIKSSDKLVVVDIVDNLELFMNR